MNAPKYLEAPGWGLPSRDQMHTIACRLIHQTAGTIKGRPKGKLTIEDAVYCVQYALSLRLNPFTDIHIWFDKKLIVTPHYRIIVGWAQSKDEFTEEHRLPDQDEIILHQINPKDLASICYILKKSQQTLFGICLSNGLGKWEAMNTAASRAIGIVKEHELFTKEKNPIPPPKGWSWQQRAETRALRNAIGRSHGNPTVHDIITYTKTHTPHYNPASFADSDFDPSWDQESQQHYLDIQNTPSTIPEMNFNDRVTLLRGKEEYID